MNKVSKNIPRYIFESQRSHADNVALHATRATRYIWKIVLGKQGATSFILYIL